MSGLQKKRRGKKKHSPDQVIDRNTFDFGDNSYNKGRFLGQGSYGKVHQLDEKDGDGKLALKQGRGMAGKEDLQHENDILEYLGEHKNIVGLGGYAENENEGFLALEYLGGGDMDKMSKQLREAYDARKITHEEYWGAVMHMHKGVANGLNHMKKGGLSHGDVKPGNVGLTEDGDVKLIDFGTVRKFGDEFHDGCTPVVNATPERLGGKEERDQKVHKKTDIYALGQMMHHAKEDEWAQFDSEKNNPMIGVHYGRTVPYQSMIEDGEVDEMPRVTELDNFLADTLQLDPKRRMSLRRANKKSGYLNQGMLEEEESKDVIRRMLADREGEDGWGSKNNTYGEAKTELELVEESEEGKEERLRTAKRQNKDDKIKTQKAMKRAKKGTSKRDRKKKRSMLKELRNTLKGTRQELDQEALDRRQ